MLDTIYIDCETYFDTSIDYCIKNEKNKNGLPMAQYILDERFKLLGTGYLYHDEYGWVRGEDTEEFKSLDWKNLEVICHNTKFDMAIFAWKYGIRPARYFDTQSLARAVLGQHLSGVSLKNVSSYLGLPPKGELKSDGLKTLSPAQEQEMMEYNKRDLECCQGIARKLRPLFPMSQEQDLDWTIRAFINPALVLDVPRLEKSVVEEQTRKAKIYETLGIEKEVFSSNDKFSDLLRSRGIEVPTKPSPTVPDKEIPALSLSDPGFVALKKLCPDLYEARIAAKSTIYEKRALSLIGIGKTGSFPFDVQFSGAVATHRYSGGNAAGGNPQNFPNAGAIRESVQAPNGCGLVVGDFSAIEAREVAWLAKEPKLIAAYMANKDLYSEFAESVYGHKVTKKDNPTERKVGKTSILGLGYNMGADKFRTRLALPEPQGAGVEITEGESYRVVNLYRNTYVNVPILWQNAQEMIAYMAEGYTGYAAFAPFLKIVKNGFVLPSGLVVQYPNLRKEMLCNTKTGKPKEQWVYDVYGNKKYAKDMVTLYGGKLVENICQAIAGEICKIAIKGAEQMGLRVVGQVHDEILVVSKLDKVEADRQTLQTIMERRLNFWPEIVLGAEVKTGKSWAEAKS